MLLDCNKEGLHHRDLVGTLCCVKIINFTVDISPVIFYVVLNVFGVAAIEKLLQQIVSCFFDSSVLVFFPNLLDDGCVLLAVLYPFRPRSQKENLVID